MPATGEAANNVMSELAYGAISIGALWLLERAVRENPSTGLGFAAGWVAGLAYQTRTVGLALVLAMIIVMAWRRRWRSLAGGMVGVGLAVGVCRLWQGPASEVPLAYEYYVNYGDWFLHAVRRHGLALRRGRSLEEPDSLRLCPWFGPHCRKCTISAAPRRSSSPSWWLRSLIWSTLIPGWIRRRHEAWAIYLLLYFAIYHGVAVSSGAEVFRARIAADPVGDVGGLPERAAIGPAGSCHGDDRRGDRHCVSSRPADMSALPTRTSNRPFTATNGSAATPRPAT